MKAAQDRRMYALAGAEGILAILALAVAFLLRLPFPEAFELIVLYWWAFPLSALVLWASFWALGLYRWVWYHLGMKEVIHLAWGIHLSSLTMAILLLVLTGFPLPKTILVLNWLIGMVFLGGTRFAIRLRRELLQARGPSPAGQKRQRALLVGAGEAAEAILRERGRRAPWDMDIIGCLDDDPHKVGHSIHGLPVLGAIQELPSLARRHEVREAIIAIPSASGEAMRRIVSLCEEARLRFRTLPSLTEMVEGKVSIGRLREVNIEDLMGRQPLHPDPSAYASYLAGARVLVTGAAGSVGSELCRHIGDCRPSLLIPLDWSENDLFELDLEMRRRFPELRLEPVIGSVRDEAKMHWLMEHYRPNLVLHAAAHKHVPLMEGNPDEAVLNNIWGSKVTMEAAHSAGVDRFVFISTDKAVNPTSIMGSTKRVVEMLLQCQARDSQTKFVAVRFGNVLGSQGSVIPVFKKQIAQGGPVTVTHPETTRYFMTIFEATHLILQAAFLGDGGEIFILDLGKPVKILDLARDMIRLSGLEEGKDVKIEFVGLRPGEKIFEEFTLSGDHIQPTGFEKIYAIEPAPPDPALLKAQVAEIISLCALRDNEAIRRKLREIVPEYNPSPVSYRERQ